jgi:hypothetical protein
LLKGRNRMSNEDRVKRFNRSLDAVLRGEQPEGDEQLIDLARTLAQVDLSPRSRRRWELRRRFQFRRMLQSGSRQAPGWSVRLLNLAQASPASRLVASLLVFVLLSSLLTLFSLPGHVRLPDREPVSARLSQATWQLPQLSPQPIPTPYAPREVVSPVPVAYTQAPMATGLSPTQIYTRLAPQLVPENTP